jgi:hypothetical protein
VVYGDHTPIRRESITGGTAIPPLPDLLGLTRRTLLLPGPMRKQGRTASRTTKPGWPYWYRFQKP